MVAPDVDTATEKEAEIWEEGFLEEVDPELIKLYQIEKRDRLYKEEQEAKKAAEQPKNNEEPESTKTTEPKSFSDIDLEDITDPQSLEWYGMEHLKFVLESKGLKCGGSIQERCKRLFSTKG